MKISFDFDGTLSTEEIQKLAEDYINQGYEVWITSNRIKEPSWNKDLFGIADKLGIDRNNIQLIGVMKKWGFLKGFDIHYDNEQEDIDLINQKTNCKGILV